ncbi:CP2 transcription factor-domain-containing protein [Aspergillus aurantiobrunneus]
MFRHRKNSQKPGSDLIDHFQQSFGGVITRRNSDGPFPKHSRAQDDSNLAQRRQQGVTPRTGNGISKFSPKLDLGLNFSPSWMDPVPLYPGCYTPRSGGTGTILHNQAGNLHSPSIGSGMTPFLRMNGVSNNQPSVGQFDGQYIAPHADRGTKQPTYAPTELTSDGLGLNALDRMAVDSTLDLFSSYPPADPTVRPAAPLPVPPQDVVSKDLSHAQGEGFRYHVTLRAPTAMVESADKLPMSYLNKGQVYDLTVMGLAPPITTVEPLRYRTFIRICFDEEEQRTNPAVCWQIWKDSRGISEAQQRGSELLAIEFARDDDEEQYRHIQIEQTCLDGFCVTWIVEPTSLSQRCSIPVRFNFLSTDFSHSKGVKGVPVRLCAKTELLSPDDVAHAREPEICYCRVKLFRDHGAERKVANDVAHVRKTVGKLEQQIQDAGAGGRIGKRRRANNTSTDMTDSNGMNHGGQEASVEDGLQEQLSITQGMFSSSRPVSMLALRGDEADDPDTYPIRLAGAQVSTTDVSLDREGHVLDQAKQPAVAEGRPKPSACFLIRLSDEASDVFRAIYLTERTAEELKRKICGKYNIDQTKIVRMLHVVKHDMKIVVDDDIVREIVEGQDMIVDICGSSSARDGDGSLEIRLMY